MNIVLFAHPTFLGSASMPRYTQWLADGMAARGHTVRVWAPQPGFYGLPVPPRLKKWMGYLDQFGVFPRWVRRQMAAQPADTLYVFSDHSLGPWVPLAASQPHVIHCHDLLAQHSALGRVPLNRPGLSGRLYQRYIRQGFAQGRRFIAISKKTEQDLRGFVGPAPVVEVVYNGVNPQFGPARDIPAQRLALSRRLGIDLSRGFLLHVGVNVWYKNRAGVLAMVDRWRRSTPEGLPLLMVGPPPPDTLASQRLAMHAPSEVHFLSKVDDDVLIGLYGTATAFLFPSIAEGFGWPIAEAMASGCPVITTDAAPMNEVGGDAAFYVPPADVAAPADAAWTAAGSAVIAQVLALSPEARQAAVARGLAQVRHFDSEAALDRIEALYRQALAAPAAVPPGVARQSAT
ncbi:glycosyltransferase [Variovorax sp. ZT4R33]|uniref:glycosyltransferase n=1 Tax=Variovorax sp. ZT4R33 TaxID=3443743 RepID=UPI003F455A5D